MQTYFIKDKEYHLHYTIGRMEQLEKILGNAITGVMVSITNGKYPTISELCTLFAYGLSDDRGDYAPIKKALEFAQQQVQEEAPPQPQETEPTAPKKQSGAIGVE